MTVLTEKPTKPVAERASSDDYLKAFQRIATSSVDAAFASLERSFTRPTPLAYDPTTVARAYSDFFSAALTSPTKLFQAQKTAVKTWINFNRHVAEQVFGGVVLSGPIPVPNPYCLPDRLVSRLCDWAGA